MLGSVIIVSLMWIFYALLNASNFNSSFYFFCDLQSWILITLKEHHHFCDPNVLYLSKLATNWLLSWRKCFADISFNWNGPVTNSWIPLHFYEAIVTTSAPLEYRIISSRLMIMRKSDASPAGIIPFVASSAQYLWSTVGFSFPETYSDPLKRCTDIWVYC